MPTLPDSDPTPKRKGANYRRGRSKGYNGQKGGARQIPWQDDPIILERVRAGWQPWMEQRSPAECLQIVREYMAQHHPDEPPCSLDTIYEDRKRGMELRRTDINDAAEHHIAEYDYALAEAYRLLRDTNNQSLNKSAALNIIAGLVEKKSRLDGSLKATPQVTVNIGAIQNNVVVALAETLDALGLQPDIVAAAREGLAERLRRLDAP